MISNKKAKWLNDKIDTLEAANRGLNDKISSLQKDKESIQSELDKAVKLIREQSEADILLNALKAVGIIHSKTKCNYMGEDFRLRQQMACAQGLQQYSSPLSALGRMFG